MTSIQDTYKYGTDLIIKCKDDKVLQPMANGKKLQEILNLDDVNLNIWPAKNLNFT